MWESGNIIVDGVHIHYDAKVYEVGSQYGINGGRVSKLDVYNEDVSPSFHWLLFNYDRGWGKKPVTSFAKRVLNIILDKYKEA